MSETPATGDRLAKVIARSGLCSRRDAETWITAGRVEVNGKKVMTPAFNVTDRDKVMVDGAPLAARQGTRVWLYHKPAGLVVTEKDPEGRSTIFEALASHGLPRVVTVGRLDINTEGLLLLTNDGGLKRVLELPATGWLRRYRVRAHGAVTQAALDGLANGIEIEGIRYGAIEAKLEREQGANVWLTMALREGKNREVKNVLGALGLEVNRLIRVSYGPFQLGDIPIGGIETVKARMLREQLGKRLAEEADVDFDSEMPGKEELVGKPTRDRLTGRGTNTVEIAKQRFRFTDSAEKTEREIREEKPRQDRPGRFGATRSAPPVKRFDDRDLGETGPPRKIIFDDGREEDFVEKTYGKKPGRGDAGDKPSGKGGPRADGPRKSFDDKPRGPRRDDAGGDRPKRSFADKPKRDFGDRPQRRPDGERPQRRPDAERPARAFAPRTRPDNERTQSPHPVTGRPGRNFSEKPRSFRPDGDRPARPANRRPEGERQRPGRDELGSVGKTYGKPRTRPDGKPQPKRDGAAPARGPRPGGRSGGRPAPGGRPGGGRPSGGPRKPRG
ncbi:pseudouridine synthase [Devosia rhodophyticola]|uniref:Pseudouridine synthase n=1 Tax=Devosia rhodophyticola TaxID=3026423 RepID=A0ABY7YZC9_9HYPH|nr:pseudouridine synthase [Devosia rhodophyticola]WDR06607.1 pseudouridine synthase [Devosia rhodophyticola]